MVKSASRQAIPKNSSVDTLFVGSLEKGFRVLGAFDDDHPSLGITEIALRTGLDKSAAQRFSNTLHYLGYLEKDAATRRYRPARKLMELAYIYLRHSTLASISTPRLIEAGDTYQTTINLAEREDTDIIYTIRIPHQKAPYVATIPGRRLPLYCTAGGLAILSRLSDDEVRDILDRSELIQFTTKTMSTIDEIMRAVDRARRQGVATTSEQLLVREISVSAPIVNHHGRPVGAVQIPVYKPTWSLAEARKKLAPLAIETADAISGALLASHTETEITRP